MGDYTTNINMYKPDSAETGYDDEVNDSFDGLDNLFGASGTHNHSGDAGHGATTELRQQGGTINSAQLPDSGAMATLFATTILANGNLPIRVQSDLNLYTDGKAGTFYKTLTYFLGDVINGTIFAAANILDSVANKFIKFGTIQCYGLLVADNKIQGFGTFHKHIFTNHAFNQTGQGGQSNTIGDDDYPLATVGANALSEMFQIPLYHEANYTTFCIRAEVKLTAEGTGILYAFFNGSPYYSEVGDPPAYYNDSDHATFHWEEWSFTELGGTSQMQTLSILGTTQDTEGSLYVRGVHIEALRIT